MQLGLRTHQADRIQALCMGDKRLLMRLGALLHLHVCVSEAILEEIAHTPAIRTFIMDRHIDFELTAATLETLLDTHQCQNIGIMLSRDDTQTTDDSIAWLCIHLDDELNNPFSTGDDQSDSTLLNPTPHQSDDKNDTSWMRSVSDLLPSLHSDVRTPLEGFLAAQGDEQRAAAIEQLRYAAPSLAVVSEIMPMILSDGADIVRERGLSLLIHAGASPVVTDILRALQRDDNTTINTLANHVERLPDDQQELIFAALMAHATRGCINATSIQLSCHLARIISAHRGLHRYIELIILHATHIHVLPFFRLLQTHNAPVVDDILRGFLEHSEHGKENNCRLLILLAHADAQFSPAMLEQGVHLLLSHDDEPKERMGLAHALRRMQHSYDNHALGNGTCNGALGACIANNAQHLEPCHDSTIFWLLAELCRNKLLAQDDAHVISNHIRTILKRTNSPHVVAILDQQLPALLPCDDTHTAQMVDPLAELLARFHDDRSRSHITTCLGKMGTAAIAPLWTLLASHPLAHVRTSCAHVLPQLCADYGQAEKRAVMQQLLDESASATTPSDKGIFYAAAASFTATLTTTLTPDDADSTASIIEDIDARATAIGYDGIDTHALLAASQHVSAQRRLDIIESLLHIICAELPEGHSAEVVDPATDDIIFVLDESLSIHTHIIPVALGGIRVISRSAHCPPQLIRHMTMLLINQWRKVSRWEVMWGPGNVYYLAHTLSNIASAATFPDPLRLQVAESLATCAVQLRIAEYLLPIISASTSTQMHTITLKSIQRILHDCSQEQYAEDEFADLIMILTQFLCLPSLPAVDALDRKISMLLARTIGLYQAHCSQRCKEILVRACTEKTLPPQICAQLDWIHQ